MNNVEKTNRKDLIMKRKGEAIHLKKHKKKKWKKEFAWMIQKSTVFTGEKYKYLKWTWGMVIMVKNVKQLKEKADKHKYRDGTALYTTTK